ncbi:MAG: hypothetical protein JWL83_3338 [Actinomycetia bacterium]|nr:hypothetical protein [Actinomycetes bacterium]
MAASWAIVTAHAGVPRWEAHLFRRVNDLPPSLWPFLRVPMQLGSIVGSLLVVAAIGARTRDLRLTLATLVGSQAAYWGAKVVKSTVARGRPDVLLRGVHVREHPAGFGYVSGHSSVAFALAAAIAPSLAARWQVVAALLAIVVAFARVYAGAHFPLDVVGGAGLGLLCGTVSRWVFGVGRAT